MSLEQEVQANCMKAIRDVLSDRIAKQECDRIAFDEGYRIIDYYRKGPNELNNKSNKYFLEWMIDHAPDDHKRSKVKETLKTHEMIVVHDKRKEISWTD